MPAIISKPDTFEKLKILSESAQYDLACSCSNSKDEHRRQGSGGKWIYPVTLPNGGTSPLFKTLMSNHCNSDCKYCPLRNNQDIRRTGLDCTEIVDTFLDYYRRGEVFGMFLSSGVIGSADNTMDKLVSCAEILRKKHKFRGYIHLKIIPGSSKAAIEKAVSLSSAVSLNIETPGKEYLSQLSGTKNFIEDIVEPIKFISSLTAKGNRYSRVKQTTQFIVGAAGETDSQIVKYAFGLYKRLNLSRVYFSSYQNLAESSPQGRWPSVETGESFVREHRLYQADFLMRKYGFDESEIIFDSNGSLSLAEDPKEVWAKKHPEFFPVQINKAQKWQLLRVPGFGLKTVDTILNRRKLAQIRSIDDISNGSKIAMKSAKFIDFGGGFASRGYLFNF